MAKKMIPAQARPDYLYEGLVLKPEELASVFALADLVCDPEKCEQFPTWDKRAAYLSLTVPEVEMLRRTPAYVKAVQQVTRLKAMEGTAQSLQHIIGWAQKGDANAFKILARMGGIIEAGPGVQVNTQVNISLERRLENLLEERRGKVVDV